MKTTIWQLCFAETLSDNRAEVHKILPNISVSLFKVFRCDILSDLTHTHTVTRAGDNRVPAQNLQNFSPLSILLFIHTDNSPNLLLLQYK